MHLKIWSVSPEYILSLKKIQAVDLLQKEDRQKQKVINKKDKK